MYTVHFTVVNDGDCYENEMQRCKYRNIRSSSKLHDTYVTDIWVVFLKVYFDEKDVLTNNSLLIKRPSKISLDILNRKNSRYNFYETEPPSITKLTKLHLLVALHYKEITMIENEDFILWNIFRLLKEEYFSLLQGWENTLTL